MVSRKYSVKDIEELRISLLNKEMFGSYDDSDEIINWSVFDVKGIMESVEDRVRTHMMAGHTADDLRASKTT